MKDFTGRLISQLNLCLAALETPGDLSAEDVEHLKEDTSALLEEMENENASIFRDDIQDRNLVVGSYVVPSDDHYFHSGSGAYIGAIVISLDPFIMVSEHGDMRWSQIRPENVKVVARVTDYVLNRCMKRLQG
jgi:hypothetical protein